MKKTFISQGAGLLSGLTLLLFAACTKNDSALAETNAIEAAATSTVSGTIAVVASATSAQSDSVYLLQPCARGAQRDSIPQNLLPAAIATYLDANYAGATFYKAYAITSGAGAVSGYVVIVYYNNKPVGLQFDAAGTFVNVLEQRERSDLRGVGYHRGRRFEHRDGRGRDSISLSLLPATIVNYVAANYSTDTLLHAFQTNDSNYVVLSKNAGLYITVFDATGTFVKRQAATLKNKDAVTSVSAESLPAAAATYLAATYPGYVFKKAFAVNEVQNVQAYVVIIDANTTTYAVWFDAAGQFREAKSLY